MSGYRFLIIRFNCEYVKAGSRKGELPKTREVIRSLSGARRGEVHRDLKIEKIIAQDITYVSLP